MPKQNWTGERLETNVFNETTIEHLHRYAMAMELAEGKTVLDLASGEGYGSALLAKSAMHVTGVDNTATVIEGAAKKYVRPNLEFLIGDVIKIPCPDHHFDIVVSFETIEHIGQHDKMLQEIKRVLKPAGILIISTPDKKNYTDKRDYKNPFHVKELYADEFRQLLEQHFKYLRIYDQQIAFSSVIRSNDATGFAYYSGDFDTICKDRPENGLYLVAIASDTELPSLSNSLFDGRSVFAEAVREKENIVIDTWTYKVGHAILYPAKLLKKIFKK